MNTVASLVSLAAVLMVANGVVVIKSGQCPEVVGQSTLDVQRYLGKWYEYQRFPAVFEAGLECTSAQYRLNDDNSINVLNRGVLRVTIFGKTYVIRNSSAQGKAVVPDPSKPAELSVAFFGNPGNTPNYIIQETDYDNYSVIFSCTQLPGFNIQTSWILTRARGVAPSNISDLKAKLTSAGVDVSKFNTVNQSNCP